MNSKLCKTVFYVKTNSEDELDDELIKFIKESDVNLVIDNDPVNYIREIKQNWKKANQQVELNKSTTTQNQSSPTNSSCEEAGSSNCSQTSSQTPNAQSLSQTNSQTPSASSAQSQSSSNQQPKDNRHNELIKTDNPLNRTVFVFKEFNGDLFKQVNFHTKAIIGRTALQYYFNTKTLIPVNVRPIHNLCMKNLFICFASFPNREIGQTYLTYLRYMGGSSRKELDAQKITHLISDKSTGTKYRVAITCGLPVMNPSWIGYSWEHRFDPNFKATDPQVIEQFRLQPFTKLNLAFINFSEADLEEMKDLTIKNEGQVVQWDNEKCTHIIIDAIHGDFVDLAIDLSIISQNVYLVYKEWFWASLEIAGRADEKLSNHLYPLSTPTNKINQTINQSVCTSISDSRNFSCDLLSPTLDFSTDSILDSGYNENKSIVESQVDYKNFSKRRKICLELLETEKNYLEVLRVIVNIFYKPLEEQSNLNPNDPNKRPLLDNTERKIIFGNIPPILEIHEGIYSDLQKTIEKWDENCSIGNIFIKYSAALLKTYPSFSNFFENTKETLVKCDEKYPRFHAFLKKNQSRPECKRQSLAELLIRPVQRLPSISLLLNDLLKHTDKHLLDNKQLKFAIDKVNEVLLHLNEDKRKTEGQIAMFDIINDIEECPASLLSANRHFLCKSDAKLILKNENKALPMKSCVLTLFLFNDVLVICKKRSIKRAESLTQKNSKTISIPSGGSNSKSVKKSYKHIDTLPLEFIKLIYHFALYEDYQNAITIVTNPMLFGTSRTYRIYPFVLDDKEVKPEVFLSHLCKQISDPNCIIKGALNDILDIDFEYADQLADKLSKSNFGFAKTISRALSIKKTPNVNMILPQSTLSTSMHTPPRPHVAKTTISTISPSPRRLSRAFSSFINFSSPLGLHRRQMSITSLNEINNDLNGTFSCPTTPAPSKKKCTEQL